MKNYNINHSTVTMGSHSPIIMNSKISNDIFWEKLETDCFNLVKNIPNIYIEEYEIKDLYSKILNKDENGIKTYVKKHINLLTSNIVINIVSQYFIDFLKKMI